MQLIFICNNESGPLEWNAFLLAFLSKYFHICQSMCILQMWLELDISKSLSDVQLPGQLLPNNAHSSQNQPDNFDENIRAKA